MYNFYQNKIIHKIFNDASVFCNDYHDPDELIDHCLKTLNDFFKIHECTFFHSFTKMNKTTYFIILEKYYKFFTTNYIDFPDRSIIGPQYIKKVIDDDEYYADIYEPETYHNNPNKRITSKLPYFFGISYTSGEGTGNFGWRPSKNTKPFMKERRKLYDILFSYCYPNGYKDTNERKKYNKLGNLAKNSIFRFDNYAKGNYRKAFDYIHRELIYRFPGNDSLKKLRYAILITLHTSQMRSAAFSIIQQLMTPRGKIPIPYDGPDIKDHISRIKYYDTLYSYIINRCKDLSTIKVLKAKKEYQYVNTIKTDTKDSGAILYYAYAFFSHLPTTDYLKELHGTICPIKNELDAAISLSDDYINKRNAIITSGYWQFDKCWNVGNDVAIIHDRISTFIDVFWDEIISVICIDWLSINEIKLGKHKSFCNKHRNDMIDFVKIYTIIFQSDQDSPMNFKQLLDLLRLYVMLKKHKIKIPTASIGYNKNDTDEKTKLKPKPVKIDTAINLIREKWHYQDKHDEEIPTDVYMKTVIIGIFLSAVMYMTIHRFNCNLFLKRIYTTQKLFYALLQSIPAITLATDENVDYDKIIHDLLGIPKYSNDN